MDKNISYTNKEGHGLHIRVNVAPLSLISHLPAMRSECVPGEEDKEVIKDLSSIFHWEHRRGTTYSPPPRYKAFEGTGEAL